MSTRTTPDARIAATREELAGFFEWMTSWKQPQPDSDVDGDLHELGNAGPDLLAFYWFSSAGDHLSALLRLVAEPSRIPSIACFTLLRSAHEMACQILWLFGPDERHERLHRFFRITREERKLYVSALTTLGTGHEGTELGEAIDRLRGPEEDQALRDEIDRLVRHYGGWEPLAKIPKLQTSEMIKEAERAFSARQADDDEESGAASEMILNVWKIHSGAAHGRFWINDVSVTMTPMTGPEGHTSITMTANLETLANSASLVCYVLKAAAWLYQERCAGPTENER